jgi:hypothetical protein
VGHDVTQGDLCNPTFKLIPCRKSHTPTIHRRGLGVWTRVNRVVSEDNILYRLVKGDFQKLVNTAPMNEAARRADATRDCWTRPFLDRVAFATHKIAHPRSAIRVGVIEATFRLTGLLLRWRGLWTVRIRREGQER